MLIKRHQQVIQKEMEIVVVVRNPQPPWTVVEAVCHTNITTSVVLSVPVRKFQFSVIFWVLFVFSGEGLVPIRLCGSLKDGSLYLQVF